MTTGIKGEKEKKTSKTTTKKVKEASVAEADVFIYVGPTTKQLTRYASFTGGLPLHMGDHFEKCKVLEKMFIPTSRFVAFEQQLTDSSSMETMLFNKVQDYFNEVNSL